MLTWGVVSRIMLLLLLVLLADLGAVLEIDVAAVEVATTATTTVVVEAATVAATRCVSRDTPTDSWEQLAAENTLEERSCLPFEETPAPISMSGSSSTIPPSRARPPVPPCSAVNAHLRSASVSLDIGITLMPVV